MPGLAWRKEKSHVMARARKYPEELLERGTRLVFESGRPIAQVARDLGIESETLRRLCAAPKPTKAAAGIS
jgi:transposase-like protein